MDVIATVRKLLTLAGNAGATEAEAAAAAAAAQRLIEAHRLDVASLDVEAPEAPEAPPEEVVDVRLDPEDRARAKVRWRGILAAGVARSQGARIYWLGSRICIVGTPSRIAAARHLYAYLSATVDRLAAEAASGRGRAYAHAWRVGCAGRLAERLEAEARAAREGARAEARAEASARGEAALVRVCRAIERDDDDRRRVEAAFSRRIGRGRSARFAPLSSGSGYHAGYRAGDGVRLGGHASLGAGAPRLSAGR